MGAVVDDAVEERLALDALAHQPALHVRDGDTSVSIRPSRTITSSSWRRGCLVACVRGRSCVIGLG